MSQNEPASAAFEFSNLIMGLSSAALSYLGVSPDDGSPSPQQNLELASQNIDIIAMLQEKTKGNLSPEEVSLLKGTLTELRLKYVEASKIHC